MIICKTASLLHKTIAFFHKKSIGFVPTMGALHQGHIALINQSKQTTEITVCSIFVNPTQFNDIKDFEKYPITVEKDILLLEYAGCDILFLPSVQEIYPEGLAIQKKYALDYLEEILEGKYRSGHFQGVCNVVERLLSIVKPTMLFLGQKDYQQCMVITKLIDLMQWKNKLQINIVPTKRETSGLAMSSRNTRLSEDEKQKAATIYQTLQFIQQNFITIPFITLIHTAENMLHKAGFEKIDYISICRADNLMPIKKYDSNIKMVVLIAAFMGEIRLIDNLLLE
ncbi:MAG: pantoate--beta-alanine ligase [Chitinophagaceae bacterium]|nr:pantoate--beta-alanine ligase [Chitinophagaceae bacterium]MCW5904621.1 pantoate--beta-alanine ligase [Chitinophagaceae bacterium]